LRAAGLWRKSTVVAVLLIPRFFRGCFIQVVLSIKFRVSETVGSSVLRPIDSFRLTKLYQQFSHKSLFLGSANDLGFRVERNASGIFLSPPATQNQSIKKKDDFWYFRVLVFLYKYVLKNGNLFYPSVLAEIKLFYEVNTG
jgi:hypothetical protein